MRTAPGNREQIDRWCRLETRLDFGCAGPHKLDEPVDRALRINGNRGLDIGRADDPGHRHGLHGRYENTPLFLSLIHISEPTRLLSISYAVFCLKKKKKPS